MIESANIHAQVSAAGIEMLGAVIHLPQPLEEITALLGTEPRTRQSKISDFQVFDSLGIYCLQPHNMAVVISLTFVFRLDPSRPFCPERMFEGTVRLLGTGLRGGISQSAFATELCPPLETLLPTVISGYVCRLHISIECERTEPGNRSLLSYVSVTAPKAILED